VEKQNDKQTKEQKTFLKLIQNEVRFGIAFGLSYYQPMKLKQIAKFIERSDPTTLHHIKQMAKEDLIQIDTTQIVGKYYKLSDWGKKLIEEMEIGGSKEEETTAIPEKAITKEDFAIQAQVMRTVGIVVKNIINHTASYTETVMAAKLDEPEEKDENQRVRIILENVKVRTNEQASRLLELSTQYIDQLTELKKECSETQEGELDVDYFNLILSVPISVMHPRKIDEASKKK